jgi:sarcosine oxidase
MPAEDVIVVGLGAMGGSALYHLARRGVRALGIDRFGVPNDRGSSHGVTRLIRKAYFEHPDYVPLLYRAAAWWEMLERKSGKQLLRRTGLVLFGPPDGVVISGVRRAAAEHRLGIEELDGEDAARRFPSFRAPASTTAVYEADAGCLAAEECVRTLVELAGRHGATTVIGETVRQWSADARGVEVLTDRQRYRAGGLVVAGGPWSSGLLADLKLPLQVVRKAVVWFPRAEAGLRADQGCPVFGFDLPEGFFYGFPVIDPEGLKVSDHRGGDKVAAADELDRELHPTDAAPLQWFVQTHLTGVEPTIGRYSICMYTMTPDEHFLVDLHPVHRNVAIAAGFSGHGFKFASIIGSVLADLVVDGRTSEPVEFLRLNRPALRRP